MPNATVQVTTDSFEYALDTHKGLSLTAYNTGSSSWLHAGTKCGVFAVYHENQRIDGTTEGLVVERVTNERAIGMRHTTVYLRYEPSQIAIEHHVVVYEATTLLETWQVVRNTGTKTARLTRLDSIALDLPDSRYELMSFSSAWGLEFEGVREPLEGDVVLETRHGRSSQGHHPWFTLCRQGGGMLSASPIWSGNWVFRFEPLDHGGYRLSGGLHDWSFFKDLEPGGSMESAHVILALAEGTDLNDISVQYARVGRRHWYPQNRLSRRLPAEWNHWFAYEDERITEAVFRDNVDVVAQLGIEVCTLDAGWFGPPDADSYWKDYRGDWDVVNTVRFPSGIRALSDYVHEHGMAFGLWCEIEALGPRARLAEAHPEFVALGNGEPLSYVCFGNPAVQEWAFNTLDRLITDYRCDWVKLDFNLDPRGGCDRTDHGHGAGDGLYEHYHGYYAVLDRIRQKHPEVLLENCSSGGLRIDLGVLQHTHTTFLSDPDWPEHDLQIFWGASTMLAPEMCLHWGWCEWNGSHPHQTFDPRDPNLQPHQLDYYTRISMLGMFGFSQKFPDLPEWVAKRYAEHTELYSSHIRRFVREADLFRLTDQPKREGRGDRWVGFQYAMPSRDEHLIFVFRLHGAELERTVRLKALDADTTYTLTWLSHERVEQRSGRELLQEGLQVTGLREEDSAIIRIERTQARGTR